MIQISISNTDPSDLFATVTDSNTYAPIDVLTTQRINHGQSVSVNVQEDGNGNCLVQITTISAADHTKTKSFPNESCAAGGTIQVDLAGV